MSHMTHILESEAFKGATQEQRNEMLWEAVRCVISYQNPTPASPEPNLGVDNASGPNMITSVLASTNEGLKNGLDVALSLTGIVGGFAIDVLTFFQRKDKP